MNVEYVSPNLEKNVSHTDQLCILPAAKQIISFASCQCIRRGFSSRVSKDSSVSQSDCLRASNGPPSPHAQPAVLSHEAGTNKGISADRYLLFPKLRATADLLMMPKEALTDRAIRNEVIPGLPLSTICELLTRFRPDELAQEPLQPGTLKPQL